MMPASQYIDPAYSARNFESASQHSRDEGRSVSSNARLHRNTSGKRLHPSSPPKETVDTQHARDRGAFKGRRTMLVAMTMRRSMP